MKKIYGLKLLREDFVSLNDDHFRIIYPLNEWITVPGNGAYVAITGGLMSGGVGPVLAAFECRESVGNDSAPEGVICYRKVKRLEKIPEKGLKIKVALSGSTVTAHSGSIVYADSGSTVNKI